MMSLSSQPCCKYPLNKQYLNLEQIQKILVGGSSFDLVEMLANYKDVWIRERAFKLFTINVFMPRM